MADGGSAGGSASTGSLEAPQTSTGPVLALVGPTASGKSAIALKVAAAHDAEIVAADAFTVYRGMDIGTATPAPAERAAVPHHLVNLLEPFQTCTVQWFQRVGRAAIAQVHARGRTALLVGGSGLYLRSLVDPLEFPPTDPALRVQLEERYGDATAAHQALTVVDPEAAARIDPQNRRRSIRALEVRALTGRLFSSYHWVFEQHESRYRDLRLVGIDVPRADLVRSIDARVDRMLVDGWLDEVAALRADPRGLSTTAAQAIGYAELGRHLDGETDLATAVERTKVRTRRYARRQRGWFASDPRVEWVPPGDAVAALLRSRP